MVVNENYPTRKIEIKSNEGAVRRCSIMVGADPVEFYGFGDDEVSIEYHLKLTIVLQLNGLPYEFFSSVTVPSDVDFAMAVSDFWKRVKMCAAHRGDMNIDPVAGLYLLQDFFGLLGLMRESDDKITLCAVDGMPFSAYALNRLNRLVNNLIPMVEPDEGAVEDVVWMIDDCIRYPTAMTYGTDPFDFVAN